MKRYNVRMGSGSMMLTESDIAVLYRSGGIKKDTACVEMGNNWWGTIDELFPLLKYNGRASVRYDEGSSSMRSSQTSAMLAGWICFGIGAAVSWFFPLGYVFFSVAVVMAIVAMATHQVSRGLILLLSSFLAIGVSAVISFVLAVGLFAAAASHVITKAEEKSRKTNAALAQQVSQLNQAARNAGGAFSTLSPPASSNVSQDDLGRQMNQLLKQRSASFPPAPAVRSGSAYAPVSTPMKPTIDTSVAAQLRRIEDQKQARENYKRQHDALQNSIDVWDKAARQSRGKGRETYEKQADAAREQLRKLNSGNLGM